MPRRPSPASQRARSTCAGPHPGLGGGGDDVELGVAHGADAEVLPDVDHALLGQPGGALEQPQRRVPVRADEVLGDSAISLPDFR